MVEQFRELNEKTGKLLNNLSSPVCPECGSTRTIKHGHRFSKYGSVQRFRCKNCEYRFSFGGQDLKVTSGTNAGRQICVTLTEGTKNLTKVENRTKNRLAGATNDIKGKIIEYLWFLKKEGYVESTITRRVNYIKTINKRGGNLLDPESVKLVIAEQEEWKNITKEHAITAYSSFLRMLGKTWKQPKYNRIRKIPFIPKEKEVNDLISGCNRKTCVFLKLLKETGMRSGEAWQLQWKDIDDECRTVSVTPEKGSNPRVLPISTDLLAMLKGLPRNSNKVFNGSLRHFRRSFRRQRKRVTEKLKNPRINEIKFHTLRHFKATMEYHKTKDILHVKQILGHKNINSTLLYTQLISFKDNDYHVKLAHDTDEACELIKTGFQYVTGEYSDGGKIFRKPK